MQSKPAIQVGKYNNNDDSSIVCDSEVFAHPGDTLVSIGLVCLTFTVSVESMYVKPLPLMSNPASKPDYPISRVVLAGGNQVVRTADYIGSFLVAGKGHHDRAEIVRQKLEAAQSYTHSKPILLLISLHGIKVCRENNEHVYMAHALRRVSYATCDPDNLQFAFLAREPKAQSNVQYCHAFVTATAAQAEELNNIVGEAFRLAYAQQQQPKSTCSPSEGDSGRSHLQNGDAMITASNVLLQNTTSPVHATRSPHMNSPPIGEFPPDRVIHKPLPPLPDGELVCDTSSRQFGRGGVLLAAGNCSPPPPPPSSPVVVDPGVPLAHPDDQHRLHKHYKHHKHRRKARPRAALDQFNLSQTGAVEDENILKTNSVLAADEDTRILSRPPTSPPGVTQGMSPPAPPPRGPSQHQQGHRAVVVNGGGVPADRRLDCSGQVMLVSVGMRDSCRINGDGGGAAKPADVPQSRPQSEIFTTGHSLHLYDMADHQSCGAVTSQTPASDQRRLSQPMLATVATSQASSPGTAVTATSIDGASQRAASFSSGSSGLSLLPMVVTQAKEADMEAAVSTACSAQWMAQPSSSRVLPHDAMELANAVWYQPHVPRETVVEMLLHQPSGSFIIRDSVSHKNCYALSVRFGNEAIRLPRLCQRASSAAGSGPSTPHQMMASKAANSVYPQVSDINHFLIEKTVSGGVRLMGLDKEWPSLSCLVLHLTVMPEMLPCPLRLPKPAGCGASTAIAVNPAFRPDDDPSGAHFRPINVTDPSQLLGPRTENGLDIGEDYQRLSDFSSIMADLKPRSRISRR